MMSFLSAIVTYRYPTTNNQLRNSSNSRQQATINDGRVTLQPVQGRQISFSMGISRTYNPGASGSNSGKQRTVISYQADDLDAYDSDCNELNTAKMLLWQIYPIMVIPSSEQSNVVNYSETEITIDSNIIPYSQYVKESQQEAVQNSSSS
ncbi:hypothetical protein Tco_1505337, partial [Tanacetum coccineum]